MCTPLMKDFVSNQVSDLNKQFCSLPIAFQVEHQITASVPEAND